MLQNTAVLILVDTVVCYLSLEYVSKLKWQPRRWWLLRPVNYWRRTPIWRMRKIEWIYMSDERALESAYPPKYGKNRFHVHFRAMPQWRLYSPWNFAPTSWVQILATSLNTFPFRGTSTSLDVIEVPSLQSLHYCTLKSSCVNTATLALVPWSA